MICYKVYNELTGVGAPLQHSTPGSIETPGTAQKGHRLQHSTPGNIEAPDEKKRAANLQPVPRTVKTFDTIHNTCYMYYFGSRTQGRPRRVF